MPLRIACEWMNSCAGCEISFLDMGEKIFDFFEKAKIVHMPLLMDSKHMPPEGNTSEIKLPAAEIGILSGGIKTDEHLSIAKAVRDSCDRVIAFGTCATHGGIPSLANQYQNDEILESCFSEKCNSKNGMAFSKELPQFLKAVYAVDEKIDVDLYLPGCPPNPDQLFNLIDSFDKKEPFVQQYKSVCEQCPAKREGISHVKKLKRAFELPQRDKLFEKEDFRCFLEQGYLCMGPATLGGCGQNSTARCIGAGVPCRGCFGPVQHEGDQRLAILNALVSNGVDINSIPETSSLLRFSGGHGRLQPLPPAKE